MRKQIEVEIEEEEFADLLDEKKRKAAKEKLIRILAERMKQKLKEQKEQKDEC